jgi:exopolysaccharide production protein ExoQ
MVKEQGVNPVLGAGFLSFWDGPQARAYREDSETSINTAHNGYLETYLDGGGIGVVLLALLLFSGAMNTTRQLLVAGLFGRAQFTFFVIAMVYNWSESSFFRLGVSWFILVLALTDKPLATAWSESGQKLEIDCGGVLT